ncbi:hypothetical protein DSC45_16950 [Streptomyces sp. YIM 130001]|uniref:MAB_1171c family putative transporter n=1 Tax=Streptomyces sp. YIM 130001 TaxID=2259644 RepID=UPI000E65B67B|nr:MAB_1171c family putative transporter [Streptomyces sp. YIM 130001]RII15931.1 hypothetical protein DSC45_16950 [Streptomyces sp. YIM 130001]
MRTWGYYLPVLALWAALAVKLPALLKWRDPLVRSVCLVLALAGASFLFGAPTTISFVNGATGIANLSGPLVYVIISGYSAACLLLILQWRGGPEDHVRRVSRRWALGYAALVTALVVLFALGDAPVERRTDFDTYYARTPWIGQMVLLYLLGHMTAAVASTVLCRRWAGQVQGWLRAGLYTMTVGWLLNLSFSGLKLAAVAARWSGRDWDALSSVVAPGFVGLAAVCVTSGILLPLVAPRLEATWRTLHTWRRLAPLWRELSAAADRPLAAAIPWYSTPRVHLVRREAGIEDGLALLRPYLNDAVRTRAQDRASAYGHGPAQAEVIGQAAMIAAAARAVERTPPLPASAPAAPPPSARDALIGVARALHTSPVVAEFRNTPTERARL